MHSVLIRALPLALSASIFGLFQVRADELPTLSEAATFVLKAVAKYGVGTVSEVSGRCVFQVRQNLVEDNASHKPYTTYKQIDFQRVQQVRVEGAPGTYSVRRLIISGDPGAYCQGTIFPEDPERNAIARTNACASELIVWSGDTVIPLERVGKAVLYISQNFCPYNGKPY